MLDIEKLKLTAKEIDSLPFDLDTWERSVADAATAKALWGLVEQFPCSQTFIVSDNGLYDCLHCRLKIKLEAAGISRPERVLAPNERWLPSGISPYDIIPGDSVAT